MWCWQAVVFLITASKPAIDGGQRDVNLQHCDVIAFVLLVLQRDTFYYNESRLDIEINYWICRAQWLRGRSSDSRLRGPGFESYAAVLKPSLHKFFHSTLFQFTQLYKWVPGCRQWWYVYEQPSRINCSIWLDASQRSWDGVWLNRFVKE